MTYQEAVDYIRKSSYTAHHDYFISKLLPTVRLHTKRIANGSPGLGESRFGGLPDVPSNFQWPHAPDGDPLAFLAQLDMTHIAQTHQDELLPQNGWLLFFYDKDQFACGLDVTDFEKWRVVFLENNREELSPASPPSVSDSGSKLVFSACTLRYESTYTLPRCETILNGDPDTPFECSFGEEAVKTNKVPLDPFDYLEQLGKLVCPPAEYYPEHRLMGNPFEEQGTMAGGFAHVIEPIPPRQAPNPFTGEMMTRKGRPAPDCSPMLKELLGETRDWRLLLQIASDEDGPGWMWGDAGYLYFWIPESRLRKRDFSGIWMEMQC